MRINNISFFHVFNIIDKDKGSFFLIFLIDAVFWAVLYGISVIIGANSQAILAIRQSQDIFISVVYAIFYYLILLAIYSLAKLMQLNLISTMYSHPIKHIRLIPNRFLSFSLLNIALFSSLFIISIASLSVAGMIFDGGSIKTAVIVILALLSLAGYSAINISHSIFALRSNVSASIMRSVFLLGNIWKYCLVYAADLIFAALYLLVFYGIGLIAKQINADYGAYSAVFSAITMIVFLLLIAFNKLYFFYIVKKNVLS